MFGPYLHEVNLLAIDSCHGPRDAVESRLDFSPVIIGLPVAHQLPIRCQLHALRLIGDGLLFGQARRCEALAEVDQGCFWNVDAKWSDAIFRLDVRFHGSRGRLVARTKLVVTRSSEQHKQDGCGAESITQTKSVRQNRRRRSYGFEIIHCRFLSRVYALPPNSIDSEFS